MPAPTINQFLDQFSRALAPNLRAAMIWNGAGFHRTHDLKVPANVTLITLPPYSPELNGIENHWHYLRSHCWSNRVYANDHELFEVASTTWCQNCLDADRIKSVCAKNYIPALSSFVRSVLIALLAIFYPKSITKWFGVYATLGLSP